MYIYEQLFQCNFCEKQEPVNAVLLHNCTRTLLKITDFRFNVGLGGKGSQRMQTSCK